MKKRFFILTIIIVFTAVQASFATPAIFKDHKEKMKDGVKVVTSCAYCHNKETGLEKKKGQDYKAIQKKPACQGAGCHK